MADWQIDEVQLHQLNVFLQATDNALVQNCVVRTAQESQLFPLMPYIFLSFWESYYRWPDQLRRAAEVISPEDVGHRARNSTTKLGKLTAWSIPMFYVQARAELVKLGFIQPEDNLEDLWFISDWWRRFVGAFRRAGAHELTLPSWDIAQEHEERVLQIFEADAFEADANLRAAAARFVAFATQYSFLAHCECRLGLHAAGPYNLGDRRLMHTRDFLNLSECDLPWLDGIGSEIPWNNLTLTVITDGVSVEITDFSSVYTAPENYQDRIVGVGLYTSDFLTDRYVPVGMDSRKDLTDTLDQLSETMKTATRRLYRRYAGWSMDQMIEAGVVTYFQACSEVIHMAGAYEQSEWASIDERTRAVWPIYNEEYALHGWVSDLLLHDGERGAANEYYLHPVHYNAWRRSGGREPLPSNGRFTHLVPARVLDDHDYSRRVGPGSSGSIVLSSTLPAKTGAYTFVRGRLSQDEMNAAARAYSSPLLSDPWRNVDDATVKWHFTEKPVDDLYRYTQERSRLLKGRGSSLLRRDIADIRRQAGERPWSDVAPLTPSNDHQE